MSSDPDVTHSSERTKPHTRAAHSPSRTTNTPADTARERGGARTHERAHQGHKTPTGEQHSHTGPDITRDEAISTRWDLIVVGLGPAGLFLAHRAQQRGLRVLGIDPTPHLNNSFGVFPDEMPTWLGELPGVDSRAQVRAPGLNRSFTRVYRMLDTPAMVEQLSTFPRLLARADVNDHHSVTILPETDPQHPLADTVDDPAHKPGCESQALTLDARWVVDARGVDPRQSRSVQQAVGVFYQPTATAAEAFGLAPDESVWMDFSIGVDTFTYLVPAPGGFLVEHTLLTGPHRDEQDLANRLEEYVRSATGHDNAMPNASWEKLGRARVSARESVAIAMDPRQPSRNDPTFVFGARAGFVNPITGYSVARSARMVDPMLDALVAGTSQPYHRLSWRIEGWLLALGQQVLLSLLDTPGATNEFFAAVLSLDEKSLWPMLSHGTPGATARGMAHTFIKLPRPLQRTVLKDVAGNVRRGASLFSRKRRR